MFSPYILASSNSNGKVAIVDQIISQRGSPAGLPARRPKPQLPTRVQSLSPVFFPQGTPAGHTGSPKLQLAGVLSQNSRMHQADSRIHPCPPIHIRQVGTHPDPVVQEFLVSSVNRINKLRSVILKTEKLIGSFSPRTRTTSVAPNPVVRAPKTPTPLSFPGFSNESPVFIQQGNTAPVYSAYVPIRKPQSVNYPSFGTQFNRLREKYFKTHNLNETRASTTLKASLRNSKNYYDNLPNYQTTEISPGLHYTDNQPKRNLTKMGPKQQQKSKHEKKTKQVQNQKLLSFPDKTAAKSIRTAITIDPLVPSTGNPALLREIDPEAAARYLPDEPDDDLIDPVVMDAAVFSTEDLLSQTDPALLVLSKADLSKIKIEKTDGASSHDSGSEAVTEATQAPFTQETDEAFMAFNNSSQLPFDSHATISGLDDESSEEERALLNTTSGSWKASSTPPQFSTGSETRPEAAVTTPLVVAQTVALVSANKQENLIPANTYAPQRITLANLETDDINVELVHLESCFSLKQAIAEQYNYTTQQFDLWHHGNILDEGSTLDALGVLTEDIVDFRLIEPEFDASPAYAMTLTTPTTEHSFYVAPDESYGCLHWGRILPILKTNIGTKFSLL